jgi:uncharacterized protein (DUF2147 family)
MLQFVVNWMANCLRDIMRSISAIWAATFLLTGFAAAADLQPTGEWLTADGRANVRIDECDGVLWGIISWEKEPGGVDSYSPDPAERNRPTLGLHILRSMKPTQPGLWQGEVYNPENGKTYDSRISLISPDVLRIEGCMLGFLCGGENWTRVKATEGVPPQPRASQRTGRPNQAPSRTLSACSGIADFPGTPHKGGLK